MHSPALSVVVVVYDMAREAARTLYTLSAAYQRHIDRAAYEVIVVDNGSREPLDEAMIASLSGSFRVIRLDPAPPSPAFALNVGLRAARGDVVCMMIDGARMLTPGALHYGLAGARMFDRSVVNTLGMYLGTDVQSFAKQWGYDAEKEDALLASIDWKRDGYRLFEIATPDESSVDGWLQPVSESGAVFARRELWDAIGGFDERFDEAGGGLVNLDTWTRLLEIENVEVVTLLGESTFHQIHGGISTNADPSIHPALFARWNERYRALRGRNWEMPSRGNPTLLGRLPETVLRRLVRSAVAPGNATFVAPLGPAFDPTLWDDAGEEPSRTPTAQRLIDLGREKFRGGDAEGAVAVARVLKMYAPDETGLDRILSTVSSRSLAPGPADHKRVEFLVATGEAHEIAGNTSAANAHFRQALEVNPDASFARFGLARLALPGDSYLWWLSRIYRDLRPPVVVEIGVERGSSLARVNAPSIAFAVDPEMHLTEKLVAQTHLYVERSDEFFARAPFADVVGSTPISVCFIDGLHTFEQALRDFIAAERYCDRDSLIVLHDTLPLDEISQAVPRGTSFWTGDVWKIVPALRSFRPDLNVFTIATPPSGLTIVRNLDPDSRVLASRFDEIVAAHGASTYASVADHLDETLAVVPNDWEIVRPLLGEPFAPLARARSPIGPYVVNRDQPALDDGQRSIVENFHRLFYDGWLSGGADTMRNSWCGYETLKCPLDFWMYQEIVVRTRPEVVVETGTGCGGSALFFAMLFDQLGAGEVISIDREPVPGRPRHPRISYVLGSSTDGAVAHDVIARVGGRRAMVVLDSDHTIAHVADELRTYCEIVRPGDYLIVEATNFNGHPVQPEFGPGPKEAVDAFLASNADFESDARCERFLLTLNPGGYLRRRP